MSLIAFECIPDLRGSSVLIQEKANLSGMQLSWQSKEMENLYKLKISYLISISDFFFTQRDALFFPEDLGLDCTSGFFSIIVQTGLCRIKPEKGIWLFCAQEKYYFHLPHENDDTKGEIARGCVK